MQFVDYLLHFHMCLSSKVWSNKLAFSGSVPARVIGFLLRVWQCIIKLRRQENSLKKGPRSTPAGLPKLCQGSVQMPQGIIPSPSGGLVCFRSAILLIVLVSWLRKWPHLSDLFLRPVVACVCRLRTYKKKARVLPCISWLWLASQMPAERVSVLYFRL